MNSCEAMLGKQLKGREFFQCQWGFPKLHEFFELEISPQLTCTWPDNHTACKENTRLYHPAKKSFLWEASWSYFNQGINDWRSWYLFITVAILHCLFSSINWIQNKRMISYNHLFPPLLQNSCSHLRIILW